MTVETAALGELTVRVNGASRRPSPQRAAEAYRHHKELQRAVHAIPFPAVFFPVVAGNLTTPTTSVLLGPEDGWLWDVRRVTLAGWTTADAALVVNLFKENNTPTAGNPQNRLRKFSDSAPGNETWSPGGGLVLHSPEQLLITGGSFTTTTGIYLALEGVQVHTDYEAEYLM